jgi:hypothetical protein
MRHSSRRNVPRSGRADSSPGGGGIQFQKNGSVCLQHLITIGVCTDGDQMLWLYLLKVWGQKPEDHRVEQ